MATETEKAALRRCVERIELERDDLPADSAVRAGLDRQLGNWRLWLYSIVSAERL